MAWSALSAGARHCQASSALVMRKRWAAIVDHFIDRRRDLIAVIETIRRDL